MYKLSKVPSGLHITFHNQFKNFSFLVITKESQIYVIQTKNEISKKKWVNG